MTSDYSPSLGLPPSVFLTPHSPESIGLKSALNTTAAPATAAWPTTNAVFYYPFVMTATATVKRFFWCNGTTASTNTIQVGVYDRNQNALVLGTATLAAGVSTPQFDNVTDFQLAPGKYYMAIRCNGTTTHVLRSAPTLARIRMAGVYYQASQATLPTPTATFAQLPTAYVPLFGLAFRASP